MAKCCIMSKTTEGALKDQISRAFAWRSFPEIFTDSDELTSDELCNLSRIRDLHWEQLTVNDWEANFDALSWLSPGAFCYYLPSILILTIEDCEPNLIVVLNIIAMLDRSPVPEWWDSFFRNRWTLLNQQELSTIEEWLYWILECSDRAVSDDSLERALGTLELLKIEQGINL